MPTPSQVVNAIADATRAANFQNSTFYTLVTVACNSNDPDALARAVTLAFASGMLSSADVDAINGLNPGDPWT
jgi:hypothetical protein